MSGFPRNLTVGEVAEVLNTSVNQVYALLKRGELRGFQIGGRKQWRVGETALQDYIDERHRQAQKRDIARARVDGDTEAAET